MLEYVSVVWDPYQQNLKSTLEMVQRWSACRIFHDFSPDSSASALMAQLQLEFLQSKRMSDKACRMHKNMNSLVDLNPAAGLLDPKNHSSWGHKYKFQVIQSPPLPNRLVQFPSAI